MALLYRKKVRDFILSLLSANFNTAMAATATAYGTQPFTLDFSGASINFAVTNIDPANIEDCQIQWSENMFVGGCLYTSDVVNKGDIKQYNIAAQMFANIDFYVRQRTGVEGINTEDEFDAIEDCVVSIMQNINNQWPAGAIYARSFEASRQTLIPLSDGFATRIPLKFLIEVYVQ